VNTAARGRNSTGYNDNIMSNFRQWWQVNVDIKQLEDAYNLSGRNATWNRAGIDNPAPLYWDNPYWTRFENYQTDERDRLIGYLQADYTINSKLSVMGRYAVDYYDQIQEERRAVGSIANAFGIGRNNVGSGYSRYNKRFIETNIDLIAKYKTYFTEKLSFNALLGTNMRKTRSDAVYASTNGGLIVPNLYALSNSINPLSPPEENYSLVAVNGIFGSASLGINDLVFIDGTLRRDVSSTLPVESRAFIYPSATTSFLFSIRSLRSMASFLLSSMSSFR